MTKEEKSMTKKLLLAVGIVGLAVALVGGAMLVRHRVTAQNASRSQLRATKRMLGPKQSIPSHPIVPPLSGPITPSPVGPMPQIVQRDELPNAGALSETYSLTPHGPTDITGYSDHWSWNIVAGNEISDPSVGVVIVQYHDPTSNESLKQTVYKIPGAGAISVESFSGSIINLGSAEGSGTYNLSTKKVSWEPTRK